MNRTDLHIGAAWTAVFVLGIALDPVWPDSQLASVLGFAVVFAGLAGVVVETARVAGRDPISRRTGAFVAVIAVGLFVGGALAPWPLLGAWLAGLAWLTGGGRLGAALGHGVESTTYIWPLVIVALGADIWSVTAPEGVTNQIVVEGEIPALAELIVLQLTVPGIGLSPILGIGDILFSALMLGAVHRLELSMRAAVIGMLVGFLACMILLIVLALPIPALPMIGLCTAIALGSSIRPKLREVGLALAVVGTVLVVGRLLG